MDSVSSTQTQTPALERWRRRFTPVVIVAALLPLAGLSGDSSPDLPVVEWLCWLVFVVDLVVSMRLAPRFLRTRGGVIDLVIVVLTFPIHLVVPGLGEADVLVIARLARVARVLVVAVRGAPGVRRLAALLGPAALYLTAITFVCAFVAVQVEDQPEFASFGDGLWWAVVTLTTVGYGDAVPVTLVGRLAGVVLMLAGLAFLGVLAGALAAFLGIGTDESAVNESATDDSAVDPTAAEPDADDGQAVAGAPPAAASPAHDDELAALRHEVRRLANLIDARDGSSRSSHVPPGSGSSTA